MALWSFVGQTFSLANLQCSFRPFGISNLALVVAKVEFVQILL